MSFFLKNHSLSGAKNPDLVIISVIASVIITFLLFALSLTVVGVLIVAIISLVDIILMIAGVDFSITGWMTEVLATTIYRFNVSIPRVDSGNLGVDLRDESRGFVAGHDAQISSGGRVGCNRH